MASGTHRACLWLERRWLLASVFRIRWNASRTCGGGRAARTLPFWGRSCVPDGLLEDEGRRNGMKMAWPRPASRVRARRLFTARDDAANRLVLRLGFGSCWLWRPSLPLHAIWRWHQRTQQGCVYAFARFTYFRHSIAIRQRRRTIFPSPHTSLSASPVQRKLAGVP